MCPLPRRLGYSPRAWVSGCVTAVFKRTRYVLADDAHQSGRGEHDLPDGELVPVSARRSPKPSWTPTTAASNRTPPPTRHHLPRLSALSLTGIPGPPVGQQRRGRGERIVSPRVTGHDAVRPQQDGINQTRGLRAASQRHQTRWWPSRNLLQSRDQAQVSTVVTNRITCDRNPDRHCRILTRNEINK